jgi:uncharacterized protein YhaN
MSRLFLNQLHARRLHGFQSRDNCILTGLGTGLNIVYAPNRSGKSTLAVAYRLVIGDDLRKYPSADVSASWQDGTIDTEAIVTFGLRRDAPAPAVLPMRYVLDMPEMIGGLSDKEKEATAQAIAGNVKIPDKRSTNKGLKAGLDSLRKAHQSLREIENAAKFLEAKRERAEELNDLINFASNAGVDAGWMRVAQYQEQLSRIDAENPGVAHQSKDAAAHLEDHLSDLSLAEADVDTVKQKLDAVAPSADQRAPRPLRESDGSSITTLLLQHEQALADHGHLVKELSGAQGALDLSVQQLATGIEPDEVIPSAVKFTDQADRARVDLCERQAYAKAVEATTARQNMEKGDLVTPESPERFRRALLDLLTASTALHAPRAGVMALLAVGAIAALLAAVASFMNATAVLILGVTSAILVGIGLVVLRSTSGAGLAKSATGGSEKPEALLDQWAELVRKVEQSKASESSWKFVQAWLQGKSDTSPSTDETNVDATWKHWISRAGLGSDASPYALATLFERWQKIQELRLEVGSLVSRVNERREVAALAEKELRAILEEYDWVCRTGATLAGEVSAFRHWFEHSEALAKAEGRLSKAQQKIQEHLNLSGIPIGDLSTRASILHHRASVAENRSDLIIHLNRELHNLNSSSIDADRIGIATARWRKGEEIELPAGIELALVASSQLDNLRQERTELTTKIATFEDESGVATARSNYDDSLANLMGDCETAQSNAVWNTLVGSVREHVRLESAPELLAVANAKLERVDAALVLRMAPPDFDASKEELGLLLVDDLKNGRNGQRFSELATSTKVNAVLAIRLALIETSEQGIAYPIFADELMAVADENTRKGIARLLMAEASERQVIVLTNQAEDAHALLEEACGNANVLTIGNSEPSLPPELPVPVLPTYRVPLGPVAPDLERDVAAHAPAFLLVEESDLAAVGHAPTIAAALEQLSHERNASLKPMLVALHEVHQYVATTTRRIRASDIENQDWLANTFRDQIFRLLIEIEGDPDEFRERVRSLKGYRENNKNALDQFLLAKGFLGITKPEFDDLVQRARAALGDFPDATRTAQWCAMRYLAFCEMPEDS